METGKGRGSSRSLIIPFINPNHFLPQTFSISAKTVLALPTSNVLTEDALMQPLFLMICHCVLLELLMSMAVYEGMSHLEIVDICQTFVSSKWEVSQLDLEVLTHGQIQY